MRSLLAFGMALLAASTAAAEPKITKVLRVSAPKCSTDGGKYPCPMGLKYMGTLVQDWFNRELREKPALCAAGVKPGSITFRFGYEYNLGTITIYETEKTQTQWPVCVKDFVKRTGDKWLEWYKVLWPIDPTIDLRNEYKVTIRIEK